MKNYTHILNEGFDSYFKKLESKKLLEEGTIEFTDDFNPDIWYKNAKHDYQLFKKNGYVLGLKERGNRTSPTPVSFPKSFDELATYETSADSYLLYRKEFSPTVETRVAFLDFQGLFHEVSNIPEYVGTYANRGKAATHTYSYGNVETFLSKLDKKANKAAGIKDYPDYHLLTKHGRSFLMNKKEVEALERLIRRIAGNDYSRKISSDDFSDIYARVYQAATDESDPNYRKVFVPDFWQYLSDSDLKRFMRGHGWENIESDEADESLNESGEELPINYLEDDLRSDVYNALSDIAFKYHNKGVNLTEDEMDEAIEWFQLHFWEIEDLDAE